MTIMICVIVFAAIFLFDFLPIIREKSAKVSWIYGVFIVASFTVIVLQELGVQIPSPAEPLKYLITSVLNLK